MTKISVVPAGVGTPGDPAIQRALDVPARDERDATLVPDTANARADVEQAVSLFFDALLRPSRLGVA